jgi:hypothetical protein
MTPDEREHLANDLANRLTLLRPGTLRETLLDTASDELLGELQRLTQRAELAQQMKHDANPMHQMLRAAQREGQR